MQPILDFILGHEALLAGLSVALFDFVFALLPNVDSSGVLHAIYNFIKKLEAPSEPPK